LPIKKAWRHPERPKKIESTLIIKSQIEAHKVQSKQNPAKDPQVVAGRPTCNTLVNASPIVVSGCSSKKHGAIQSALKKSNQPS